MSSLYLALRNSVLEILFYDILSLGILSLVQFLSIRIQKRLIVSTLVNSYLARVNWSRTLNTADAQSNLTSLPTDYWRCVRVLG